MLKVSYTASGALNDPCRYPHFVAAREYLAGALRLDAAALALRARMEDPAVAAALDCKPDLLLGAMAHPHLAVRVPFLQTHNTPLDSNLLRTLEISCTAAILASSLL